MEQQLKTTKETINKLFILGLPSRLSNKQTT